MRGMVENIRRWFAGIGAAFRNPTEYFSRPRRAASDIAAETGGESAAEEARADATATEIYAKAYTQNPQAAEFYNFLKSMETYRKVLNKDATLVFSTDSDLFGLLKRASAKPQTLPPAR